MNLIEEIISKFKLDRFFSSKLILAIDLFVSLAASAFTLILVKGMIYSAEISWRFILIWLILSLMMSFVCF